MAVTVRHAGRLLAVALLGGCKNDPQPPPKTEPWPAPAVASAPAPTRVSRYVVARPSSVRFELPAKSASPRGSIEVVHGEAAVVLGALEQSRAEIRVDLGALRMESSSDGGAIDRQNTLRALNWLKLGASLPEAEREARRWAVVQIALSGRDHDEPATDTATFTAHAAITINDFRVERRFDVRARLHRPTGDGGTAAPDQIDIETVKPIEISLAEHAIEPRDALGALIAADTKLLGDQVGRTAKVTVALRLVPAPAKR